MTLPPYASLELVQTRLLEIFPNGTPNRNYCTRKLAASTVFSALYIGATEESGQYFGPKHVYRMTNEQSVRQDSASRLNYIAEIQKKSTNPIGTRWYADNTREPIRDETLGNGLVDIGAVLERKDLATTSSVPRYSLKKEFAQLFDPMLQGEALSNAVRAYQDKFLSKGALARVSILRAGAAAGGTPVEVKLPNGATRHLAAGPSSLIAKFVIEVFAQKFLSHPVVLWLSESNKKVFFQDDSLAKKIGIEIKPDKHLPDLILVDLGPSDPEIVFVELVSTDGAITASRQEAMYAITDQGGFKRSQVAFVTAYADRESSGFKKTISGLAWGSIAWFCSEPDGLLVMRGSSGSGPLSHLTR